jgi:ABC-type metal ion transport system substrate-binding protein
MVLSSTTLRLITTNAHLSDARLSQMTGLSRVGVWKIRKRYNLPKPTEKYKDITTPPLLVQFIERNMDWTARDLAEQTGLYINTIYKIKRKLKLNKNHETTR